jgi:hypothetical protein
MQYASCDHANEAAIFLESRPGADTPRIDLTLTVDCGAHSTADTAACACCFDFH